MKQLSKVLLVSVIALVAVLGFTACFKSTPTYAITKSAAEHGSFTVSKAKAKEGTVITITPAANLGYHLDEINVYKTGDVETTITVTSANKFTMPAYAVTVVVTFAQDAANAITLASTENGSFDVTVDDESAEEAVHGTTVTIVTEPDTGYGVDEVTVYNTDLPVQALSVTDNGDGTYEFMMPNFDVTVCVTFVTYYSISLPNMENGELCVQSTAKAGAEVVITADLDTGYTVEWLKIWNTIAAEMVFDSTLEENWGWEWDGSFTFEMPGANVDIWAETGEKKFPMLVTMFFNNGAGEYLEYSMELLKRY